MVNKQTSARPSSKMCSVHVGQTPGITLGGVDHMPFHNGALPPIALALEANRDGLDESLEASPDLLCLRPQLTESGIDLDRFCRRIGEALDTKTPLIVMGSGDREYDCVALPEVAGCFSARRLALGSATEDTYKLLVQACLEHDHVMIAESPIDINICKQLNILATDYGLPIDRILIDPTTGGLGYGIEYTYSIMERARLAALSGDTMLACPQICFVGAENARLKEASEAWEAVAATALIMAGAAVLVFREPQALILVRDWIKSFDAES